MIDGFEDVFEGEPHVDKVEKGQAKVKGFQVHVHTIGIRGGDNAVEVPAFVSDEVSAWCAFVAGVADKVATDSEENTVDFQFERENGSNKLGKGGTLVRWDIIGMDEVEGVGASATVVFAIEKASEIIGVGVNPNLAFGFEIEMAEFEGGAVTNL